MKFEGFVASLKNLQYNFPKMRGGGQRLFGTFPKIHPIWKCGASLRDANSWQNLLKIPKVVKNSKQLPKDGKSCQKTAKVVKSS